MPEPAPNPAESSQSRLRPLGYGLLIVGFLWLGVSAGALPADVHGAAIRYLSEGLRGKGGVSGEVLQARGRIAREVRSGLPWVFTPALLMFCGALILVLPPGRREGSA